MNGFCCATSRRIQCCKRIIRNWKKLNGGRHHANPDDNYCNAGRYWRNRSRQRGSSRSVVRRVLPLPSPSLLRLLPVSSLPSLLAPLAPLVLALAGGPNSKAVGDTRMSRDGDSGAKFLPKDGARRIAANIAKLPELVRKP